MEDGERAKSPRIAVASRRLLREVAGARFVAGVLLHCGDQTLPFGDRLWAAPLASLLEMQDSSRHR
jgi:hypothetical protein